MAGISKLQAIIMSNTYFCFSDECGDYKPSMSGKQKSRHPFYIRTTLLINSSEWKYLNSNFKLLKKKYNIPKDKELKWANLWSLRHFQKNKKPIPDKHELKCFEKHDYHDLINFVEETLALLNDLDEKKIIATYTKNENGYNINEKSMLAFHLQELMQRIEMTLQVDKDNLGVLFFDPVAHDKNEMFREIYYNLFEDGDYIDKYHFIKDSLNIENSHHSVGIQIADYISGSFSAVLKSNNYSDYELGINMFYNYVYPNLRSGGISGIHGYGIREVPSGMQTRRWLVNKIKELKTEFDNSITF